MSSLHWVGYTFPISGVTGVRAQWKEPTVTGKKDAEEFTWLGIGGWNNTNDNIIQVGTFAYFPTSGGTNQGIWYELVPEQQEAKFPLIRVGPGDQIFASIVRTHAPRTWQLLLVDVTTGATFKKTVQFDSLAAYPSFVVEDPNDGPASTTGPFFAFPHWGKVTFSNMEIRVGTKWVPAASIYAYRVQMIRNGQMLASAGSLTARSSFSAIQE